MQKDPLTAVRYMGIQAAPGEAHLNRGAGRGGGAVLHDRAGFVGDDGVAAFQDAQGAQLRELGGQLFDLAAPAGELPAEGLRGGGMGSIQAAAVGGESGAQIEIAQARGQRALRAGVPLEQRAQPVAQAEFEFIDALRLAPYGAVQQAQRPLDALLLQAAGEHANR
jgi:hypothetical protein